MRLTLDQLAGKLVGAQCAGSLSSVYLLCGEEPLQLTEAADLIRTACREHGFADRQVYTVLPGFDWNRLAAEIEAFGLFSDKRLLDVRVPDGKVSPEGARVLTRYAERPSEGTVLLLLLEGPPTANQKAAWFAKLEQVGVVVQVYPLHGRNLSAWLERRAQSKGLKLDREALELLLYYTEGNLLAADQEMDKLLMLYGAVQISAEMLAEAVIDSARFDVFALTEAWLLGKVRQVDRILAGLRAEGTAPAVILWAIARELRLLLQLMEDRRVGISFADSCRRHRLWDRRAAQVECALQRLNLKTVRAALEAASRIDTVIKGKAVGDVWAQLREVCLALAAPEAVCFLELD
ncbi:MAG: DNA polymerase III subunit delta [Methylohalobius sp.]|nr:DNA polymerase III subunit delta [Methylohalobius sp.]